MLLIDPVEAREATDKVFEVIKDLSVLDQAFILSAVLGYTLRDQPDRTVYAVLFAHLRSMNHLFPNTIGVLDLTN